MEKGKITLTQKDAENTPAGGVVVGKRDGQTMIYDDASLGGYFVGKLHKDGGIKMINKSTGQPLEVQGSEVIITAPAVNDQTKREFEGKMMTNREILSKINSDGGGVSFADGGDIPAKIHTTDCEYKFGGKLVKDTDIAHSLGMNSTLKKGKQQFSSGDTTYDVDAIYNAIKKGKLRLKTKEVETFPMKYPVYDKHYAENHKIDFRKPNGIIVRTESGEEVLIDGNHRMNNAYLKGKKTMKTYYIEDPKQIAKFTKNSKFELGGENTISKKEKQEIIDSQNKFFQSNDIYKLSSDALYVLRKDNSLNPPKYKRYQNFEDFYSDIKTRERNSIERENAKKVFEYLESNGAELQHKSIYGSRYYFYKGENIRVSNHWQTSEIKDSETGLNKYRNLPSFYSDEKNGWKKMIDEIESFVNPKTFELGGENNNFQKLVEEKFSEGYGKVKHFELNSSGGSWSYINNPNVTRSQRDKMPIYTVELANDLKDKATEIKKNYEISQPKEISILQFAKNFAKDNNGKIYHKSKSGSVYVRVKDKEIRISDHNILDRDSMNPKNRYDLEIIQTYFDEKTPSNLDYWIDEFKNGGHLSKGKSLKQIAEMHNVSLAHINEELAKGLEVEKEHFADFKERTRVAKDHLVENPNYYTILEKSGLKRGGHIQKEELIEDAKKGDTPARDLDDYNDVLDIQADGMVGGNNGLAFDDGGITPIDANSEGDSLSIFEDGFANGGGIELPKVSYVIVSNSGSSLSNLIGNKYNSYIEFVESVEYAYKELGKKVRSYVQLQAFDENSIALIDVTTYISDQKNTIKNFNPLTGNYKNLEKSLANSRPISFKKFNWQDWLLSKVTPSVQTTTSTNKSASTSTQSQYPEYYEFIGNESMSFSKGKIYKIINPKDINEVRNFIDNLGTPNGFSYKNKEKFKPSTEEAFLAQQSGGSSNSAQTLSSSSNQSSLEPKIVDAVNVEFVYPNGRIEMSATINISNLKNALTNFWNIVDKKSWEVRITPFENQFTPFTQSKLIIGNDFAEFNPETFSEEQLGNKLKSLYPDLDWSYFLKEKTTTSTNALNSAQKFDFTDTKIDVEDNPDLSLRVQKKAFEEGWEWENGGGKTLDYDDFNYLYFTKTSVSYGNITSSFLKSPKRKITEEEIFGSQPSSSIKTTAISNEVTHINLRYEKNGTPTYYSGLAGGKEFIEAINSIEQANPIQEVSVNVAVSYKADNRIGGSTTEKLVENINFGKGAFQPSNFNVSEIKSIVENDWFDGKLDFNDFFRDIVSTVSTSTIPTSNSAVPKTVENAIYNLDLAVQKLEKASSTVVTEYNKEIYDKSLKFLYDTKATYELALKFTPESAFMYERLDILKKLADIEKNIKKIEDMKKGGTFYMLAKILEKLERGENWKQSESAEDVITNHIPKSEIEIIIRSQKFKNWFGDWEKALINDEYDNVSKALTDGIPSVYHHGARRIKYTYREVSNGVLYLAENISYALWFSQNATAQSEEGNYLTECFVNIKNPIDLTAFHVNKVDLADIVRYIDAIYPMAKIYDFIPAQVALLIKTNQPTNVKMWAWQLIRSYAKFVNHIKENTPYDGFLYYENNPSDEVTNPVTGQLEENVTKAVAIFKSHQVKVVDAVLFDGGLDDWRFENGGKIKN
jgi:hypothetical protein